MLAGDFLDFLFLRAGCSFFPTAQLHSSSWTCAVLLLLCLEVPVVMMRRLFGLWSRPLCNARVSLSIAQIGVDAQTENCAYAAICSSSSLAFSSRSLTLRSSSLRSCTTRRTPRRSTCTWCHSDKSHDFHRWDKFFAQTNGKNNLLTQKQNDCSSMRLQPNPVSAY